MMNSGVGINTSSSSSAERGGGAEAQGVGGARVGGHLKWSTEQPHPQQAVRVVPSARGAAREATTAVGQPRAPSQPRQQHEQRRELDNRQVEVKEEEEMVQEEGGEEQREQPHPPRTVRSATDARGSPQVAATAQTQLRAHQPSEEVGLKKEEEEYSHEAEEAEGEVEAAEKVGRQREQHAQAPGATFEGREEAGEEAVAPGPRRARLPPGGNADTAVEGESDDDHEKEDGEEVEDEVEDGEEEEGEDDGMASGGAAIGDADDRRSSQVVGVYWTRDKHKWGASHRVNGKQVYLGHHATEEGAAQAVHNYAKDGVKPVKRRAVTSQFKGVHWDKHSGKWRAICKRQSQGLHAAEEGAAQAYNKEAERIGLVDLNVIPPAGDADDGSNAAAAAAAVAAAAAASAAAAAAAATTAAAAAALALPGPTAPTRAHAGAGSKRAAPNTPAPPQAKTLRLDTLAGAGFATAGAGSMGGAERAGGAAAGARAAAAVAAALGAGAYTRPLFSLT